MRAEDCLPPLGFGEHVLAVGLAILIVIVFVVVLLVLMASAFFFGEGLFDGTSVYEKRRDKIKDALIATAFGLLAVVWLIAGIAAVSYDGFDKETCTEEQMEALR